MIRTVAMLALLACGPSAAEIRLAKSASYNTDFAIVWNAVAAEVHKEYRTVVVEDAVSGKIQTDWQLVEKVGGEAGTQPIANNAGTQQGGRFFRVVILVKGGPPWTLAIDGEAAEYKPGMSMIVPYRHGVDDEPTWVNPRIDKLYASIYERLKPHALEVVPVQKKVFDNTRWGNLPNDAAEVVAAAWRAAGTRDVAALRVKETETITSALGENLPADRVTAVWNADPAPLAELAGLLGQGCDYDQTGDAVTCPRGSARVTFAHTQA